MGPIVSHFHESTKVPNFTLILDYHYFNFGKKTYVWVCSNVVLNENYFSVSCFWPPGIVFISA